MRMTETCYPFSSGHSTVIMGQAFPFCVPLCCLPMDAELKLTVQCFPCAFKLFNLKHIQSKAVHSLEFVQHALQHDPRIEKHPEGCNHAICCTGSLLIISSPLRVHHFHLRITETYKPWKNMQTQQHQLINTKQDRNQYLLFVAIRNLSCKENGCILHDFMQKFLISNKEPSFNRFGKYNKS